MRSKFNIRLLSETINQRLDGFPLFYNFIYYNELMDAVTENLCCRISSKTNGYFSFERPEFVISSIIDYKEINHEE